MDWGQQHGPECCSPVGYVGVDCCHERRCHTSNDGGYDHESADLDPRNEEAGEDVDACAYDYHREEADRCL